MRIERRSIQEPRPPRTGSRAVLALTVFHLLWIPLLAQAAEGEHVPLQERIEREIQQDPFVSSEDVSVRVDQGVVGFEGLCTASPRRRRRRRMPFKQEPKGSEICWRCETPSTRGERGSIQKEDRRWHTSLKAWKTYVM